MSLSSMTRRARGLRRTDSAILVRPRAVAREASRFSRCSTRIFADTLARLRAHETMPRRAAPAITSRLTGISFSGRSGDPSQGMGGGWARSALGVRRLQYRLRFRLCVFTEADVGTHDNTLQGKTAMRMSIKIAIEVVVIALVFAWMIWWPFDIPPEITGTQPTHTSHISGQ
jgi:hypothetical protein